MLEPPPSSLFYFYLEDPLTLWWRWCHDWTWRKPASNQHRARRSCYRPQVLELEPRLAPSLDLLNNLAITTNPGVQQQPSIAVDPRDSQHLVVAYMDRSLVDTGYAGINTAVSRDGGTSRTQHAVPLPAGFEQGAANPTVRFDDQGRVFVSFMAATFLGEKPSLTNPDFFNGARGASDREYGLQADNGVFLAWSDDGGLTWGTPLAIVTQDYDPAQPERLVPFDVMPELAIDTFPILPSGQTNPFHGKMYLTWTRVYPPGQFPGEPGSTGGGEIMLAVSTDHGQTWTTQLQPQLDPLTRQPTGIFLSVIHEDGNSGQGLPPGLAAVDQPHLAIGPEGDLYVSSFGLADFSVHHSTDGGQTFAAPDHSNNQRVVFGNRGDSYVNEYGFPNNQFRIQPIRAIVADPVRPGHVYAVDNIRVTDPFGNELGGAEIFFGRSTDHGLTWQTTFQINDQLADVLNDDNGGQHARGVAADEVVSGQAMPRLSIDAVGNLAVIWYDNRRDPAGHLLDVFGTVSTDGGLSFSPNFRLNHDSYDADQGAFTDPTGQTNYYLGDFLGLALVNNTAYATWAGTAAQAGNQDIYLASFSLNPAPAAPNDRFEPNDGPNEATDLGQVIKRFVPRLELSGTDEDWFLVEAASTGDLTVTARTTQPAAGIWLELWDETGSTRLATGTELRDNRGTLVGQELIHPGQADHRYLVRVFLAPETAAVPYSLNLQSLKADLGTQVAGTLGATVRAGDKLGYLLTTGATGALDLHLQPAAHFQGSLRLEVFDLATQQSLVVSPDVGVGETQSVSLAIQQGQTLILYVVASDNASGDFALAFRNLDQLAIPENNRFFFSAGAGPSQLGVGDFNQDGKPDLAVSNGLSNTVSILLGNGDGTFQAPRQFTIGAFQNPNPVGKSLGLPNFRRALSVADVNRDGDDDVIVANYDSGDISVLLGQGDGTFKPQRRWDATAAPFGLAVGDLNGDRLPEVVAIQSFSDQDSTVAVLRNLDQGRFAPGQTFLGQPPLGQWPTSTVRLGDLNNDDRLDLVVSGTNANRITVFLGNGDATFDPVGTDFTVSGGRLNAALLLVDLDDDGNLDVVALGIDPQEGAFLLGKGDGTFADPVSFFDGQFATAVAVADLGGPAGVPDGVPDLIVAAGGIPGISQTQGPPGIFLLPGLVNEDGQFAGIGDPQLLSPGVRPQDVAVVDVNGDDVLDVVAVDAQGIRVILSGQPVHSIHNTPQTARDLGTVVHVLEPTQTIVPGHEDAFYTLTVPREAVAGAGDEVLDFSGLFQYTTGAGLRMAVTDQTGRVLGSGERFRIVAPQGTPLLLHVFGLLGPDGTRGAGAYTLDIDILPQVVSVEAQALLPGVGAVPGGPTSTLVLTFQGDRLDPGPAQEPTNYQVRWLGPDQIPGTTDDQIQPLHSAVHDPSTNVDVATGTTFPVAVRQTVTLAFASPLPAGAYLLELSEDLQTAAFNASETALLTSVPALGAHPVVSRVGGQVLNGSQILVANLVQAAGSTGDLSAWFVGTPFLTQLHDDLGALLDGGLTELGDAASIPKQLDDEIIRRFEVGLSVTGEHLLGVLVLWLDPVSIHLRDPQERHLNYNLVDGSFLNQLSTAFVSVAGNVEVLVLPVTAGSFVLSVANVPARARGGTLFFGANTSTTPLTEQLRAGQTEFRFDFGSVRSSPAPAPAPSPLAASGPSADLGLTTLPVAVQPLALALLQFASTGAATPAGAGQPGAGNLAEAAGAASVPGFGFVQVAGGSTGPTPPGPGNPPSVDQLGELAGALAAVWSRALSSWMGTPLGQLFRSLLPMLLPVPVGPTEEEVEDLESQEESWWWSGRQVLPLPGWPALEPIPATTPCWVPRAEAAPGPEQVGAASETHGYGWQELVLVGACAASAPDLPWPAERCRGRKRRPEACK